MTKYTHFKKKIKIYQRIFLPILLVLLLSASGAGAQTVDGLKVAITQVDSYSFPQVTFYVTVADENGLPVRGLTAADFNIFEDGVRVPTTNLTVESVPIKGRHFVLAMDLSTYSDILPQVQDAAKAFVRRLGPEDRVSIQAFYDEIEVLTDFTNNTNTLESAIDSLSLRGDYTTLNKVVLESAAMIEDFPAGRKALIILPDCKNNIGTASPDAAITQVNTAEIPLYLIGVETDKIRLEDLAAFAANTGGLTTVAEADKIEEILLRIANQQPQGYRITYISNVPADNREHALSVVATHKNQTGQADGTFIAVANPVGVTPNITEGQTVGGKITLSAEVKAVAPPVTVSYGVDDQFLGQTATPPYAVEWNTVTAYGQRTVTVRAVDNGQNIGEAKVNVNVIPAVIVTTSTPETEIALGDDIVIEAKIEAINPLARVDLLVDGEVIASQTSPPYGFTFDSKDYLEGNHTITVRAVDEQGFIGESTLTMAFLPAWPERIRKWIGIEDRAVFQEWLDFVTQLLIFLGALLLILLLILLALFLLRRLLAAHRRYSRQTLGLAVLNLGNSSTRYQLQAEDGQGVLRFSFRFNGVDLREHTQEVIEDLPPPDPVLAEEQEYAEPTQSAEPASQESAEVSEPAPAESRQSGVASSKEKLKDADEKTRKAMGVSATIGNILSGIARILPRSMGRPLQNTANQMRMGRSRVQRTVRVPRQVASTTSKVKSQASTLTPTSSSSQSSTAASTAETQPTAQAAATQPTSQPAAAQTQPMAATSTPAQIYQTPSTTVTQPANGRQTITKTVTVRLDHAQTPEIAPGKTLTVDMVIDPAEPFKSRDYPFEVISRPVNLPETETDAQQVIERGIARIVAMPWILRFLSVFFIILVDALLILVVILLALWLMNVDIWGYLTWPACNVQRLWGGTC